MKTWTSRTNTLLLLLGHQILAQVQAPALAGVGSPISDSDRIYTGDQSSNTITVIMPSKNEVLGTISLGDIRLGSVIGPQYIRSVNSHGLGFSRDGKYIVSLSVTSNTVTVVRTLDNLIVSQTFVDRQPHEAFFSADNRTIWIGTRGVDSINIIDGLKGTLLERVPSYGGPSKVLFSPDGATAYVNHIRAAYVDVIDVPSRRHIYNITGLADVFSSDMMLSADGKRLWVAHKMVGKVSVVSTQQHKVVAILNTGPETNHPNFAIINGTTRGFVTVAALNATMAYDQPDPEQAPQYVGMIKASGIEPHGLWPSPDNSRMFIVNEHSDTMDVADPSSLTVLHTLNVGQESQALVYVAGAVPSGGGRQNLGTQGLSSSVAQNRLVPVNDPSSQAKESPSALITIRKLSGLDMFQIIGRNLVLNSTYLASASCLKCNGLQMPLVEFSATTETSNGCGSAPQVLAFFKFFDVYELDSITINKVT
jgi:DNA-binding beta-propeller fold protein YncE